jgi:hypothetical protein
MSRSRTKRNTFRRPSSIRPCQRGDPIRNPFLARRHFDQRRALRRIGVQDAGRVPTQEHGRAASLRPRRGPVPGSCWRGTAIASGVGGRPGLAWPGRLSWADRISRSSAGKITALLPINKRGLRQCNCHFPGMLEHVGRLVGFGMKLRAQRERLRPWPARRHDDADSRPSLCNLMGQG